MEIRPRYGALLALVAALNGFSGLARASNDNAVAGTVRLVVINLAGIPDGTLRQAEQQMARIYRHLGIQIYWNYPQGTKQAPDSAKVSGSTELIYRLRFLPRPAELGDELKRQAAGFACSGGPLITVFWQEITEKAASIDLPAHIMLAYVAAHELGHIFLPHHYHGSFGIMCSHLRAEDWRLALDGRLRFSKEEARQILAALKH